MSLEGKFLFSASSLDTPKKKNPLSIPMVPMLPKTITDPIRATHLPSGLQSPPIIVFTNTVVAQLLLPVPTLTWCCLLFTSVSSRRFCSLSSRSRRCSWPCCRRIS